MSRAQKEYFPCHACGELTHIDDLDGKPNSEGDNDWTRLECKKCYGRGYRKANSKE